MVSRVLFSDPVKTKKAQRPDFAALNLGYYSLAESIVADVPNGALGQ
jgi:hypothetical protein